jgi:uncharacterized protein YecE (DUF72 family)
VIVCVVDLYNFRTVITTLNPSNAIYLKQVLVGCAGWSVPKNAAAFFPIEGSHLQRYAARFNCVEINSSFYRSHRAETYARWAETVPNQFRFSVKLPRTITHYGRLVGVSPLLDAFFEEVGALGEKLGCVLVQLPPSLKLDQSIARRFFSMLHRRCKCAVAIEPRHPSWFTAAVDALLIEHKISRVAADPAIVPLAGDPGGDLHTTYFRLHGSPKIYYSEYDEIYLTKLAEQLQALGKEGARTWCVFDNTALGAATLNALDVQQRLDSKASIAKTKRA